MYDIVTIGGATCDIFLVNPEFTGKNRLLQLKWGEKHLVSDLLLRIGGGACNAAVGFARLGFKTTFWGKVGNDFFGEKIAQKLKEEKVSLQFLNIDKDAKTSLSCLLSGIGGERTIVMYRGKNDDLLETKPNWDELCQTKWFYLTDVASTKEDLTLKIAKLSEKRKINLAFIPGQNQLKLGLSNLKPVLKTCEVFILNIYEAFELLGKNYEKRAETFCGECIKEVEGAAKKFVKMGVKIVVITRDVCGAQAYDGKNTYQVSAPLVENPVDTTGAGDAFSCGFVGAIIKGEDVETALSWGTANAGSVISAFGAQTGLLRLEDIMK